MTRFNVDTFDVVGLVAGGRIGPQILGHQGPRLVVDRSDVEQTHDKQTGLYVCPIDRIFNDRTATFIVFGVPNTALILPNNAGNDWDNYSGFMMGREPVALKPAWGRVQAGVFYQILGLPPVAQWQLRKAMNQLVGGRRTTCARAVALALHKAGFTTGGKSLRWIFRPSKLAAILWRNGLEYQGRSVRLRIIQTRLSVSDHFHSVWTQERNSPLRLVAKVLYNATHGRAPAFDPAQESIAMSDTAWRAEGPTTNVGITVPSKLGTNLSFVLGEQPEFRATLPGPITNELLQTPLTAFEVIPDWITWVKSKVLFSPLSIWLMREHLDQRVEWLYDVPTAAAIQMLRRSPSHGRQPEFVYNFVVTSKEVRIKRLLNANGRDNRFVAWMLAKHVLLSGWRKDVLMAGELWCYINADGEFVIRLLGDSGTYRPSLERAKAAAELLSKMFNAKVEIVSR